MSRPPTLLNLLSQHLGTCKVSMSPNPWVQSWSGGVIGCTNVVRRLAVIEGRA